MMVVSRSCLQGREIVGASPGPLDALTNHSREAKHRVSGKLNIWKLNHMDLITLIKEVMKEKVQRKYFELRKMKTLRPADILGH